MSDQQTTPKPSALVYHFTADISADGEVRMLWVRHPDGKIECVGVRSRAAAVEVCHP